MNYTKTQLRHLHEWRNILISYVQWKSKFWWYLFLSIIIILTLTPLQNDKLQSVLGYFMTLHYSRPGSAPVNFLSRFYTLFMNLRFLFNSVVMVFIEHCFSFHCLSSTDSVRFCRKYRFNDYLTNCFQVKTK